jgi:hypothetical protein
MSRTNEGPNFSAILSIEADMSLKYFTLRAVGIATVLRFVGLLKRFLVFYCSTTTYEVKMVVPRALGREAEVRCLKV